MLHRTHRGRQAALPSTVRSSRGRLDIDQAAEAIHEDMPWLKTETADDLVQFFERQRVYRQHHGRIPDLLERRVG